MSNDKNIFKLTEILCGKLWRIFKKINARWKLEDMVMWRRLMINDKIENNFVSGCALAVTVRCACLFHLGHTFPCSNLLHVQSDLQRRYHLRNDANIGGESSPEIFTSTIYRQFAVTLMTVANARRLRRVIRRICRTFDNSLHET